MRSCADVARRVLSNGLTLLVERDTAAPVVAVVTHVKAGYFDEPDEWSGIAHVLEHMFFKGTPRRGPGAIAQETQLVGGYLNAGTIYDKTVYYTVLPSTHGGLEKALDVQSDALMHAALDPDELARELEVIVQEAKRKLDTPGAVTTETLYSLLFRVHRMRRWRIGTEAVLRSLTADDVRRYYETRYTPERVIVAIVGDVEVDRVLDLAEATYGDWARPSVPVEGSPPEPNGAAASTRALRGDVKRPLARLGWRTVGTLHPDAAALDVAASVLGEGRGSRLYRAVRIPGIAAAAYASHYTPTEVGVFEIGLEADPARIDEAVEHAWGVCAELADRGPAEHELDRVRALVRTSWSRHNESMEGRASALCQAEAMSGYALVDEMLQRTLDVTADDVCRAMRQHASADRLSAVLYLPESVTSRFESAWPPAGGHVGDARAAWEDAAPAPSASDTGGSAAPSGECVERPGGIVQWTFPGVDVLIRPKAGSGVVTLLLHFPGIPALETPSEAGLSWLLARTALRGAGGMEGEALAQASELLGGAVAAHVGTESLGWGLTVAAGNVARAAALLAVLAREPHLAEDACVRERELQMSDARRIRDDMFRYPLQQVLEQAFPAHAYGLPKLGQPETLAALEREDLRRWAARVAASRPIVVLVGDIAADDAIKALAPLTGWVAESVKDAEVQAPSWRAGRGSEPRQKEQSALAMAFPSAPFSSADRDPLTVAGSILSGLAGRLFDELREKRSLAYTVAAFPWLARRAGAALCYIATSPEREEEARDAMLAELRRLTVDPPTAEELERARNYAAGTVEIRQQSGRAVAGEMLEAWVHGSLDDLDGRPARLRRVTTEDVLRVAGSVFDAERRAEYVVRGTAR